MTTDAFIGWLHDLRYSRMVCMLLPTEAVMGYPVPTIRDGGRMLVVPFFEKRADAYWPCGWIAVPHGGKQIAAFASAQWLPSAQVKKAVGLYNGDPTRMDAYYTLLAQWEAPDAQPCVAIQQSLLAIVDTEMADFYKALISDC